MKLRQYQEEALSGIGRAFDEGSRKVLAVLATGCGKTVIFASLIDRILRAHPDKRVMVLAHREELIWQARDKIQAVTGRSVGVEMGQYRAQDYFGRKDEIVVSTIQTQNSGTAGRMMLFEPEEFALVVVDEAHHATSRTYQKVINHYLENPACKLVGVTATPDRADEESLGKAFESVAYDFDVGDAIRDGWLCPITQQMVTITGLDFSGIKTTAGDLNGGELAEEMEREKNLYGVADATRQLCEGKQTLIFTASVRQAERLSEILNRYRPGCATFISGETPKDERKFKIRQYHDGEIQFLVNCSVFTEGFDEPNTAAVVIARPTKSRALYAQMIGRGTRPHSTIAATLGDGPTPADRRGRIKASPKPSVLVLDFVGNAGRHKLVTAIDILGGCGSAPQEEEVIDAARKIVEDEGLMGREMPTEEALEQARKEVEERKLREAAKRAKLKARASFGVTTVDPFACCGIKRPVARGWDRAKKPSEKMVAALSRFGVEHPDKLTYTECHALLDKLINNAKEGRPSYKQTRLLQRLGVRYPVRTFEDASRIISERLHR